MKELTAHIHIDPEIRIEQQQLKRKEFYGKMKIHNGQKVFELNLNTGLVVEANPNEHYNLKGDLQRELDMKEDCIYLPAINIRNARKKFLKRLYKVTHA